MFGGGGLRPSFLGRSGSRTIWTVMVFLRGVCPLFFFLWLLPIFGQGRVAASRACELYIVELPLGVGDMVWIQKTLPDSRNVRLGLARIKRVDDLGGVFADVVQNPENCGSMEGATVVPLRNLEPNPAVKPPQNDVVVPLRSRTYFPGRVYTALLYERSQFSALGIWHPAHVAPSSMDGGGIGAIVSFGRTHEWFGALSVHSLSIPLEDSMGNRLQSDKFLNMNAHVTYRYLVSPWGASPQQVASWAVVAGPQVRGQIQVYNVTAGGAVPSGEKLLLTTFGPGVFARVYLLPAMTFEVSALWFLPLLAQQSISDSQRPLPHWRTSARGHRLSGRFGFGLLKSASAGLEFFEERLKSASENAEAARLRSVGTAVWLGWVIDS